MIYLGLDEGKSGTRVVALDENGHVLAAACGAPGNLGHHAPNDIVARWKLVVDSVLARGKINHSEVRGMGFGLASLVWPSDRPLLEDIVSQLAMPCRTDIFDDCFMVLRAGLPQAIGIALLAGSGSGVIGRNAHGITFQTFGNSRLGDGGGGWAISERMIESVALTYLGDLPETLLTNELLSLFSIRDVPSLLECFTKNPAQFQQPSVYQILIKTYELGDQAARHLFHNLACRYVQNICAVAKKLGLDNQSFELTLYGGLFDAPQSPLENLINFYVHESNPDAILRRLQGWPAVGAALIAMDSDGLQIQEVIRLNALEESAQISVEQTSV